MLLSIRSRVSVRIWATGSIWGTGRIPREIPCKGWTASYLFSFTLSSYTFPSWFLPGAIATGDGHGGSTSARARVLRGHLGGPVRGPGGLWWRRIWPCQSNPCLPCMGCARRFSACSAWPSRNRRCTPYVWVFWLPWKSCRAWCLGAGNFCYGLIGSFWSSMAPAKGPFWPWIFLCIFWANPPRTSPEDPWSWRCIGLRCCSSRPVEDRLHRVFPLSVDIYTIYIRS